MTLGGQVQIDQGGIEAVVAKVLLNAADIDPGFQKMCGIGMAQGVNGDHEIYCNWPVLMIKEEWITGGIFDLPRSGLLEPRCCRGRRKSAPPLSSPLVVL